MVNYTTVPQVQCIKLRFLFKIFKIKKIRNKKFQTFQNTYSVQFLSYTYPHLIQLQISKRLVIEGVLSLLRQFLATESPLRMKKNAFCFTLKALFVLKIFIFLTWLLGHVKKRLD